MADSPQSPIDEGNLVAPPASDPMIERRRWARLSLFLGITIFAFYGALLAVSGLGLAFKIPVSPAFLAGALAVTAFYVARSELGRGPAERLGVALAFLLIQAVSVRVALDRFDLSFDGRWYHKEAIAQISLGWNPYRDAPVQNLSMGPNGLEGESWHEGLGEKQINGFPKGTWLVGAAYALMFDSLEAAKAATTLLLFASLFTVLGATFGLVDRVGIRHVLAGLLVAFNATSVSQVGTTMVDGQMASLLIGVLCFGALILRGRASPSVLLGFGVALGSLMLVKFTGIVFAVVLLSGGVALGYAYGRRTEARSLGLVGTGALIVSFLAAGWHPYLTNTLKYGWPFYPLSRYTPNGVTPDASSMDWSLPTDFQGRSNLEKLARSIIARSEIQRTRQPSTPKLPWQIFDSEAECFAINGGCHVGGWGPLFALSLILVLIGAFLSVYYGGLAAPSESMAGLCLIVFSVLVIPESFVARYVPQSSFIPVIAWLLLAEAKPRRVRLVSHLLVITMILNTGFVLRAAQGAHMKALTWFSGQIWRMNNAQKALGEPLLINFGNFRSLRFLLKDRAIEFKEVPRNLQDCQPVEHLYEVAWCAQKNP